MKLMSLKQYTKMSKLALVKKIILALKKMPRSKLAVLCYQIDKRSIPRLTNFTPMTRQQIADYVPRVPRLPSPARFREQQLTRKRSRRKSRRFVKAFEHLDKTSKRSRRSKGKSRRFVKGSPEAKRYMAKLRKMRK